MTAFLRKGEKPGETILAVCNFTSVPRHGYRVGVTRDGFWKELLNSDSPAYWGSGMGNLGGVWTENTPSHGRPYSLSLTLPPLSIAFFKCCD